MIERLAEDQAAHLKRVTEIAEGAEAQPAEAMRRYIALTTEMSFELPEFLAFLMQEAHSPGERWAEIEARLLGPFERASAPIIAAAQRAGAIRTVDTKLFSEMLLAAISLPLAFPALHADKPAAERRDAVVRQALALFVCGEAAH